MLGVRALDSVKRFSHSPGFRTGAETPGFRASVYFWRLVFGRLFFFRFEGFTRTAALKASSKLSPLKLIGFPARPARAMTVFLGIGW